MVNAGHQPHVSDGDLLHRHADLRPGVPGRVDSTVGTPTQQDFLSSFAKFVLKLMEVLQQEINGSSFWDAITSITAKDIHKTHH